MNEVAVERLTDCNASSDSENSEKSPNVDTTKKKEINEKETEESDHPALNGNTLKTTVCIEIEQSAIEGENICEQVSGPEDTKYDTVVSLEEIPEREGETTSAGPSKGHPKEIPDMALEPEELLPDLMTPILKTLILNIGLPTLDIYLDMRFVRLLFPEYWGCGLVVVGGILTNFLFTALAWWRLEPRHHKSCTWILLLLQIWPQFKAVQVIWLTTKRDLRAVELGELLDREVMSLEPFLEALPSMLVMRYMVWANPQFSSYFNMLRAFYVTVLGMTLFLKNGPCFILPRRGIFGFITWRSIMAFLLTFMSLNIKYFLLFSSPVNMVFMGTFGAFIALLSLYEGLGCWRSICRMVLFCPPLLILPIFGFFTFGKPQAQAEDVKGVAFSSKWTIINMFGSCLLSLVRYLSNLPHTSAISLHAWLLQFPGAQEFTHFKSVGLYLYCLLCTFVAMLFTLLLLRGPLACGVLLPNLPGVLHVVQEGEVQPLIQPPPPSFTRWGH